MAINKQGKNTKTPITPQPTIGSIKLLFNVSKFDIITPVSSGILRNSSNLF